MKRTAWLAFEIDRGSETPVFEQICRFIRQNAIAGELREGAKLPATRAFAAQLGVSRPTIVTAYEQLAAEGYLTSRVGSGYYLCGLGDVELAPTGGQGVTVTAPQTPKAAPQTPVRGAPPSMPFRFGQPDMRLFPHRKWAKTLSSLCRTQPEALLAEAPLFGNLDLRRAIAEHVAEWRGIAASPDQIVITAGSTDALELCMRALSSAGDVIGLEDPGYMPTSHFAEAQGLQKTWLEIDAEGACLPDTAAGARLVVLTPSHQFPLGGAMSPQRRMDFIRWARDRGGWIIEDDYDSEFRYAGRPIPALAGFDQLNRTLYVGSFTKVFSKSLRLGYIICPREVVAQFQATLQRFRPRASLLPQQGLANFMASGDFYRHLRRMRRSYGQRRAFLLDRLRADFADLGYFEDHQAGMQIVFYLRPAFDSQQIARQAAQQAVSVAPLVDFSSRGLFDGRVAGGQVANALVLGFSGYTEAEMSTALDRLRGCFDVSL